MTATISITQQNFEITGVGDVIVTDTVQDPNVGDYVRDIRVFDSSVAGLNDVTPASMLIQIRLRSSNREAIEITAPTQQF